MKVRPYCRTCLSGQTARIFDALDFNDEDRALNISSIEKFIDGRFSEDKITADLGTEMHREIKRLVGYDPFENEKERSNEAALKLVDYAHTLIENADDPLYQAFKIAIAGNLIDLGIYEFSTNFKELEKALSDDFVIDDYERIKKRIESASKVLYLCDNAGEIVFDRLCIGEIQKLGPEVVAVVKSGPIVNDATMHDARTAGLHEACNVLESGADCVGVIADECSGAFLDELNSADLIIAKGQGHFETMEHMELPIAFVLKAKCKELSSELGVKPKSSVVMLSRFCSSQDR